MVRACWYVMWCDAMWCAAFKGSAKHIFLCFFCCCLTLLVAQHENKLTQFCLMSAEGELIPSCNTLMAEIFTRRNFRGPPPAAKISSREKHGEKISHSCNCFILVDMQTCHQMCVSFLQLCSFTCQYMCWSVIHAVSEFVCLPNTVTDEIYQLKTKCMCHGIM